MPAPSSFWTDAHPHDGLNATSYRRLVLDLHGLRVLEPDAVPALWAGLRAALRRGGSLHVAGLRPSLRGVVDPLVPHGLGISSSLRAASLAADDDPRVLR